MPDDALVLDELDAEALREAFDRGRPVLVRAERPPRYGPRWPVPRSSCVVIQAERRELLELDFRSSRMADRSSRPTRSSRATSRRDSGASRRSRSSSASAPSFPGPSRMWEPLLPRPSPTRATGPKARSCSASGLGAEETVERLTAADDGRAERQLGIVDAGGGSASFTGAQPVAEQLESFGP